MTKMGGIEPSDITKRPDRAQTIDEQSDFGLINKIEGIEDTPIIGAHMPVHDYLISLPFAQITYMAKVA